MEFFTPTRLFTPALQKPGITPRFLFPHLNRTPCNTSRSVSIIGSYSVSAYSSHWRLKYNSPVCRFAIDKRENRSNIFSANLRLGKMIRLAVLHITHRHH
jgi:hypothetical protein